jgi:hypothetical protein
MNSAPLWVAQRAAADRLGVSERTLIRWRAIGLLQAGKHWRRKFPGSSNSPVLYRLEDCDQAMSEAFARGPQLMEVI